MGRVTYTPNPNLYKMHYGGSLPVFRGMPYQDGYGIGGIFSKIGRSVVPMIKSVSKTLAPIAKRAGKSLLKTGTQVLSDVVLGDDDIKSAVVKRGKQNLRQALQSTNEYLDDDDDDDDSDEYASDSPIVEVQTQQKRKKTLRKPPKRRKMQKGGDIFDI